MKKLSHNKVKPSAELPHLYNGHINTYLWMLLQDLNEVMAALQSYRAWQKWGTQQMDTIYYYYVPTYTATSRFWSQLAGKPFINKSSSYFPGMHMKLPNK